MHTFIHHLYPYFIQLLYATVLLQCLSANVCKAQSSCTTTLHPHTFRPGDFVERHAMPPSSLQYYKGVWSVEGANIDDTEVRQSIFSLSTPDSVCTLEQGKCQYYTTRGDTLYYNGMESNQFKLVYDLPERRAIYPLSNGQSLQGFFHGTGTYCDKYFLHTFGRYNTSIESYEKMVTAKGDTLRHILKTHTTRMVSNIYYPIDSVRHQQCFSHIFYPADSILAYQNHDSVMLTEDIVCLYAQGVRYPVVECRTVHVGDCKASQCYYMPYDEQTGIALDEVNQIPDSMHAKSFGSEATPTHEETSSLGDGMTYVMTNNRDTHCLHIAYQSSYTGYLRLILSDITGRVISMKEESVEKGQHSSVSISYDSLRRGQYVMYLSTNYGQMSETFTIE